MFLRIGVIEVEVALEVLETGNMVIGGFSFNLKVPGFTFPATASSPQHSQTCGDAYIAEFNSNNILLWATRLANNIYNDENSVCDITEDPFTHDLLVLGNSDQDEANNSIDFIPYGSSTYPFQGGRDAFIMRFGDDRALLWSTYFGGTSVEQANSIVALENGDFVITGSTESTVSDNFPVMM